MRVPPRGECLICMLPAADFARVEHLMVGVRSSPGEIVRQIQEAYPQITRGDIFRHDPHIQAGKYGNAHRRARDAVLDGMVHEHELYLSALEHMLETGSISAATGMAKLVVQSRAMLAKVHGLISADRGPMVQVLNAPVANAGGQAEVEALVSQVRQELERRKLAELEANGTPVLELESSHVEDEEALDA